MATHQPDEKLVGRSDAKYYIFTSATFIKREIPLCERHLGMNGNSIVLPWLEERFRNEAAALDLIRTRTTIPVPKLVSWGKDEKGSCIWRLSLSKDRSDPTWLGTNAGCQWSITLLESAACAKTLPGGLLFGSFMRRFFLSSGS